MTFMHRIATDSRYLLMSFPLALISFCLIVTGVAAGVGSAVTDWTPRRWRKGAGDPYFTTGGPFMVPRLTGPEDPYFALPLWLRRSCGGGQVLWAYNLPHLELLERYVAARQRERPPVAGSQTLVERLPAWVKAAGNRDAVLAAIRALRAQE